MRPRQIKFKVWDKAGKFWVCDYAINSENKLVNSNGVSQYYLDEERLVLMQFTGLCDNNGKEIYEGDFVKHQNVSEPLEVYWCDATGQWKLCKEKYRHYYGCLYSYPSNMIKVIGNIYEKPELMGDNHE